MISEPFYTLLDEQEIDACLSIEVLTSNDATSPLLGAQLHLVRSPRGALLEIMDNEDHVYAEFRRSGDIHVAETRRQVDIVFRGLLTPRTSVKTLVYYKKLASVLGGNPEVAPPAQNVEVIKAEANAYLNLAVEEGGPERRTLPAARGGQGSGTRPLKRAREDVEDTTDDLISPAQETRAEMFDRVFSLDDDDDDDVE